MNRENNILDLYYKTDDELPSSRKNPFYISEFSKIKHTILVNLREKYEYLYILCSRNHEIDTESIEKFHQKENLMIMVNVNKFVLIQAPFELLLLKNIKEGIVEVNIEHLKCFNHYGYELENQEMIYLMLASPETIIVNWLNIYKNGNNIDDFISKKIFLNYYGIQDNIVADHLINLIKNMNDFKYWKIKKNCKINYINFFENRLFNWSSHHDSKNRFVSTNVEKLPIKCQDFQELLISDDLTSKEKYYLFCNLSISKNYCHVVINKDVLKKYREVIDKYYTIIKYCMSYTWLTLHLEETTMDNNRTILNLQTISLLPVYPFTISNPYLNPYFTCLVPENVIKANVLGVENKIHHQQGVCNISEFKKRLNIFITQNASKNLLEGVNWSNMVVTGSIMAGIIPKFNPLFELFMSDDHINDHVINLFFQEYYSDVNIDIACNHESITDFVEHVKHLRDIIQKNLKITKGEIQMYPTKSLSIYVNRKLLEIKCTNKEIPFTYDFIVNNIDKKSVKFYFYELYIKQKNLENNNNRDFLYDKLNDDNYFEIMNYCDYENTSIIITDEDVVVYDSTIKNETCKIGSLFYIFEGKNESKIYIKFSECLKYQISSPHLKHKFEIFKINTSPSSMISKFHLPCERCYYDGQNCYLLPSAFTAYQTLINIDFKYSVSHENPVEIINKYRRRGYGVILNERERQCYLDHASSNILGELSMTDNFFKPVICDVISRQCINESKHEIEHYYKNDTKYEFYLETSISREGNINPVKEWLLDAAYYYFTNDH